MATLIAPALDTKEKEDVRAVALVRDAVSAIARRSLALVSLKTVVTKSARRTTSAPSHGS